MVVCPACVVLCRVVSMHMSGCECMAIPALNLCEYSIRVEGSYLKVAEGWFSTFFLGSGSKSVNPGLLDRAAGRAPHRG